MSEFSMDFRSTTTSEANQNSGLEPPTITPSIREFTLQFIDWPPRKQLRGLINPYPLTPTWTGERVQVMPSPRDQFADVRW
jgi:hypothetical protein